MSPDSTLNLGFALGILGVMGMLIGISACHETTKAEGVVLESTEARPEVYTDPETGCEYLFFSHSNGIAVIPRVEPFGTNERVKGCHR